MAKVKPTKIVSKKHLARQERERRETNIIAGVAGLIILIVVMLIGYGILDQTVLLARRPLVTVNGESATVREFQAQVRAARQQYISQYMTYQQYSQFGLDLSTQMDQITSQLDNPAEIGQQVITNIEESFLIRQYANANGITVTEADIENEIQNQFGFYPDGTPTPAPTSTGIVYPALSSTQLALMTPTATLTLASTPTLAPTLTPDLSATPTSIPSITPTATPYTLTEFQKSYTNTLDQYTKLGMSEAYFRKIYFEDALYRKRVTDLVTASVPHEQEQVHLRQILVADETLANDIYAQLQAGADFAELAVQNSLDTASKDQGGDLGWLGADSLTNQYGSAFETAVFALKIGVIGQPLQTTYGWQIVQSLGHEVRPFTESEYQDAVTSAFNTWLSEQRAAASIVDASNWTTYVPTVPTILSVQTELATQQAQTQAALPSDTPAPVLTETPTP